MKRYTKYSFLVLSVVFLVVLTQMPFGAAFHPLIWFVSAVVLAMLVFIIVLRTLKRREDKRMNDDASDNV